MSKNAFIPSYTSRPPYKRPWFGSGGLATEGTERSWQIHSVPGSHLRSLLQKTGKPTAVEPRNEQPRIVSVAGLPDCAVTTHTDTQHTHTNMDKDRQSRASAKGSRVINDRMQ